MSQPVQLPTTPKKQLKTTMILFVAIVIGILLFMLVAVLINQTSGPLLPDLNKYNDLLTGGAAILSMLCLLFAKRIFNNGIVAAKDSLNPLSDKLNGYRLALIKYLAICETALLINVLLFLFTGKFVFQVYSAVLLGFMLAIAPISRRVIAGLQLDWQQQKELE